MALGKPPINLALQGGGAHGAYTWGVLDRLLELDCFAIEGVSGTSAGAMNAAALVDGFAKGGSPGARQALDNFWRQVAEAAHGSPLRNNPMTGWLTGDPWNLDGNPFYRLFDVVSRLFSPYELNPLNHNPLRPVLEASLDLDNLNACRTIKLYVTATRVEDGRPRVFTKGEITVDALLASACIPQLFQAVEIDGENYWDGGFMGNPVIWPLIYRCQSPDVLLVQINPLCRGKVPRRSIEIINRVNEITFNSSLIAELRAISFVSKLVAAGQLDGGNYKQMRIHLVEQPQAMAALNASSKLNADWQFLCHLKALGRSAADRWLADHRDAVGMRPSVDIDEVFLGRPSKASISPTHPEKVSW
ncbi:MAG: patatin-like phospholipase family protein [Candidatus Competibacterales bacterium]